MSGSYKKCRVCGKIETPLKFNINLKIVPICQRCATAIFLQEARWLVTVKKLEKVIEREIE